MSVSGIVNVVGTIVILIAGFYFANKVVKGSQAREKNLLDNGKYAELTILSMKQTGLFINNNPVIEMNLKVVCENESWLAENHKETALAIASNSYDVGKRYEGRIGNNKNDILFVLDESGKPKIID